VTTDEVVDAVAQEMRLYHPLPDLLDSDYLLLAGYAVRKVQELRLTVVTGGD
jgi:hypothetical protein